MKVFVLAPSKTPMMPCSQARARLLLTAKEAAVFRRYPFTIILKRPPSDGVIVPLRFKADPGSKVTGIVVTRETKGKTPEVVFAAELTHRGNAIKNALDSRRGLRRSRRARHTRYRPARFDHRTRTEGWLAPSLMHRVLTTMTWFNRLRKLCPLSDISVEVGTGGRTKFNRIRQGLPKEHWVDAACVGESGTNVVVPGGKPLRIKAMGHGSRRMCGTDKFGFRRRNKDGTLQAARERRKVYHGFQTGDVVVYKGGIGRISACCQRPRFNIGGKMVPLKKVVRRVHRQDGYAYA